MIIEKKAKKKDKSTLEGTITPKQAKQMIYGLTNCIVASPDKIIAIGGGEQLVLYPKNYGPSGNSSRYDYAEVLALRDCLVLMNTVGHNTKEYYASSNEHFFDPWIHRRVSAKDSTRIANTVTPHLESMGMEIVPSDGGMLIRKKSD